MVFSPLNLLNENSHKYSENCFMDNISNLFSATLQPLDEYDEDDIFAEENYGFEPIIEMEENHKNFRCKICDQFFFEEIDLNLHIESFHQCQIQAQKFEDLEFKNHSSPKKRKSNHEDYSPNKKQKVENSPSKEAKFHCEKCGKGFKSPLGFKLHQEKTCKGMEENSDQNPGQILKCPSCQNEFASRFSLKIHQKSGKCAKPKKSLKCKVEICPICSEQRTQLATHLVYAHNHCRVCDLTLETKDLYTKHMEEEHSKVGGEKNSQYRCKKCDKGFKTINGLNIHQNGQICDSYTPCQDQTSCSLIGETKSHFKCKSCQKCFSSNAIDDHIKRSGCGNSTREKVICYICSKDVLHLNSHLQNIHNHCTICDSTLPDPEAFQTHMLVVHSKTWEKFKLKKSQCKECGRVVSDMDLHRKLMHNYCSKCKITLPDPAAYLLHLKVVHNSSTVYLCDHCEKNFNNMNELQEHLKTQHDVGKARFYCETCGKSFSGAQILKDHVLREHTERQQEWSCDLCPKTYKLKRALKQHIKRNHTEGNKEPCKFCNKLISKEAMKQHVQGIHGNVRHYCQYCDKSYQAKTDLRRHVESVHEGATFPCQLCSIVHTNRQNDHKHVRAAHGMDWQDLEKNDAGKKKIEERYL